MGSPGLRRRSWRLLSCGPGLVILMALKIGSLLELVTLQKVRALAGIAWALRATSPGALGSLLFRMVAALDFSTLMLLVRFAPVMLRLIKSLVSSSLPIAALAPLQAILSRFLPLSLLRARLGLLSPLKRLLRVLARFREPATPLLQMEY